MFGYGNINIPTPALNISENQNLHLSKQGFRVKVSGQDG